MNGNGKFNETDKGRYTSLTEEEIGKAHLTVRGYFTVTLQCNGSCNRFSEVQAHDS